MHCCSPVFIVRVSPLSSTSSSPRCCFFSVFVLFVFTLLPSDASHSAESSPPLQPDHSIGQGVGICRSVRYCDVRDSTLDAAAVFFAAVPPMFYGTLAVYRSLSFRCLSRRPFSSGVPPNLTQRCSTVFSPSTGLHISVASPVASAFPCTGIPPMFSTSVFVFFFFSFYVAFARCRPWYFCCSLLPVLVPPMLYPALFYGVSAVYRLYISTGGTLYPLVVVATTPPFTTFNITPMAQCS